MHVFDAAQATEAQIEAAKAEYIAKYGEAQYTKFVDPLLKKGVQRIFHVHPTDELIPFVMMLNRIVAKARYSKY